MKTVVDAVNDLRAMAPTITGEAPFGEVKLILTSKRHDAIGKNYYFDGSTGFIEDFYTKVCTRDEFNQCVAEMSEAKWIPESKPVFTQAMAEAGQLPPVGVRVMIESRGIKLEGYRVHGGVVCIGSKLCGFTPDNDLADAIYSPIKTEREKAIEEISEACKLTGLHSTKRGRELVAEEIYNANYRKLTPSQAKAYDDKTEYFGEDYK